MYILRVAWDSVHCNVTIMMQPTIRMKKKCREKILEWLEDPVQLVVLPFSSKIGQNAVASTPPPPTHTP